MRKKNGVKMTEPLQPHPGTIAGGFRIVLHLEGGQENQRDPRIFGGMAWYYRRSDEPLILRVCVENVTDGELEYLQMRPERDFRFVVQNEKGQAIPLTRRGQGRTAFRVHTGPRMGPYKEIVTVKPHGTIRYRFPLYQFYDMSEPTWYRVAVKRVFPMRPFRENDAPDFERVQHQLEYGDDIAPYPDLLARATSNEVFFFYDDMSSLLPQ